MYLHGLEGLPQWQGTDQPRATEWYVFQGASVRKHPLWAHAWGGVRSVVSGPPVVRVRPGKGGAWAAGLS